MAPTLKVFFHDSCFDGATSAALFVDFYRTMHAPSAQIALQGVQHSLGDPFAGLPLDAEDNVCVDFRYNPDPRMTWWFDHHVSAFQPPALRAQFEAEKSHQKFYDPAARSCSLFEARVLKEQFGYEPDDPHGTWAELLAWADRIDGAQFESAREAVEASAPALQIMVWLGLNRDPRRSSELILALGHAPLAEIAARPWIAGPVAAALAQQADVIERVRVRAQSNAGVVYVDLSEDGIPGLNKFIGYLLYPDSVYTVVVTRSPEVAKISVGSNPWAREARRHNIATICERYGGGGHPVVGAVTLPADQIERARAIAQQIRVELTDS